MMSLTPELEDPMEPFECGLPAVSSFSLTGDIQIFKLAIFLTMNSSKLIVTLLALGKSKLPYSFIFTIHFFVTLGHKKQSKPSLFDQKFKNDA